MRLLADGSVVTGAGDVLHVLDPASGRAREVHVDLPSGVTTMVPAAAGGRVVLGTTRSPVELAVWDVVTEAVLARARQTGESGLDVEGDPAVSGELPAAVPAWATTGPQLVELDTATGRALVHELPWLAPAERGFQVHAPAGWRQVLVLDHEGPTVLYDLDARRVLQQLPVHAPHSSTVQQLRDGSCWLVHSATNGALVQVTQQGAVVRQWASAAPLALSVEPTGRYGAVTLRDRIQVLDLHQGRVERELFSWPRQPTGTRGPLLLEDGSVVCWSLAAGFEVLAPSA